MLFLFLINTVSLPCGFEGFCLLKKKDIIIALECFNRGNYQVTEMSKNENFFSSKNENFLVKKCCLRGNESAENEIFSSRNGPLQEKKKVPRRKISR